MNAALLDTVVHRMYVKVEKMKVIIVIIIVNVVVINVLQIMKKVRPQKNNLEMKLLAYFLGMAIFNIRLLPI